MKNNYSDRHTICNNCVMDTSDASIVFNEKGICDHCINFL